MRAIAQPPRRHPLPKVLEPPFQLSAASLPLVEAASFLTGCRRRIVTWISYMAEKNHARHDSNHAEERIEPLLLTGQPLES